MTLATGQGQDGAGGGAANAGEGLDRLQGRRKVAAMAILEQAGGAVEVAGPGVVAQAGPVAEHLIRLGRRQVRQTGEAGHEALEIGDDRRDLGLLEHDLGDPDPVGAGVALPGQILAAMAVEPGEDALGEVAGSAQSIAWSLAGALNHPGRRNRPRGW
jgi:hypothetical protein